MSHGTKPSIWLYTTVVLDHLFGDRSKTLPNRVGRPVFVFPESDNPPQAGNIYPSFWTEIKKERAFFFFGISV
jgi:hypothetical protein